MSRAEHSRQWVVMLAVLFFMAAWPARVCAQARDVNKNPVIISDRQAIAIDRRLLAAAKKANNPQAVKLAKERLSQDTARLKRDLASIKREYHAIRTKKTGTKKEGAGGEATQEDKDLEDSSEK
ncbi:MAG: hypothetical protein ACE14U_05435 [Candidatus Velamenicoccus archaeovorus]